MRVLSKKKFLYRVKWLLLAIMIIYNSGYLPMMKSGGVGGYFYLFLGVLGIALFLKRCSRFPLFSGGLVLIAFLFIILSGLINGEPLYASFLSGCIFFSSFYVTQRVEWESFVKSFVTVMRWLTVSSLVIFYYIQFNKSIIDLFPQITFNNTRFANMGIFFIRSDYIARNQSLFWEPGVFAGILVIAIILVELFGKKKNIDELIFIVGIISTNSTTGILVLFPVAVFVLLHRIKKMSRLARFAVSLFAVIASLVILMNIQVIMAGMSSLFNLPVGKIYNESISYTARLYGPVVNLGIFVQHPIFGAGWNNATQLFISEINNNSLIDAQTSTMTYYLAAIGIAGLLINVIIIVGCMKRRGLDLLCKFILLGIMFILLNTEPYYGLLFFTCLLFYITKDMDKRRSEV